MRAVVVPTARCIDRRVDRGHALAPAALRLRVHAAALIVLMPAIPEEHDHQGVHHDVGAASAARVLLSYAEQQAQVIVRVRADGGRADLMRWLQALRNVTPFDDYARMKKITVRQYDNGT